MKFSKLLLFTFSVSLPIISCQNSDNTTIKNENVTETTEQVNNEEHNEIHTLSLNEGKKWKVNDNMLPYIQKGQEIFNTYVTNNESDYIRMAKSISIQDDSLVNNCTMEGKSHDALHAWLAPHLELIESLKVCSDNNQAQEILSKLTLSYKEFNTYFE